MFGGVDKYSGVDKCSSTLCPGAKILLRPHQQNCRVCSEK